MKQGILLITFIFGNAFVESLTNWAYSTKINFPSLANRTEFVDKTLLIRRIVEIEAKQIIITTPHRCGKSTNMAMLKLFFEIELNEGDRVTKAKRDAPVTDTYNYAFFENNKLKITRNKKIMNQYFGKFPVLHVDFKCKYKVRDSENSVFCFRQVIHEAFFEHRYLRKSDVLSTKERRYVKKWCDNYGAYEEFYGQDVTNSLYKLAIILYKHYQKEVIVLIDNYDFPTTSAMPELKDAEEFVRVLRFNMGIIAKLLSADYRYLEKAVVFGTSHVTTTGIHKLENAKYFGWLDDHPFITYFSFSSEEVDRIVSNPLFNLDSKSIVAAHKFYGGYYSLSGKTVYNLHSILKFLQFRKAESYCLQPRAIRNLGNLLKLPFIKNNIESLVKGEHLVLPMYENITEYDIMNISKAISNEKFEDHFNINLLLYFMLEQGFLTYVASNQTSINHAEIKIPNIETRTKLSLKLKDYYDKFYVLDQTHLRTFASFFYTLSPSTLSNKSRYKMGAYWFYKSFEDLIRSSYQRFKKLKLEDVNKIVFSALYQVVIKDSSDFYLDFHEQNGVMDCVMTRGTLRYYVQFIANLTSSDVLEHMLMNNVHVDGEDPNLKGRVFVGLGTNEHLQPSISCLVGTRNISEAVHIP